MILLEVSVGRGRPPGVGPRIRGFFCFAHPALPTARLDFKKCYGYGSVIANKNEGLLALEFAFI